MASYYSRFVGLDLEATDLSNERGRIIEVGVVRYEKGLEVAEFKTLIDPGMPIPPIITSITGIREQDVVGKPTFEQIKDDLAEFVGDSPIVGHNINFDVNFLAAQGLKLNNPLFDTWVLATMLLPAARSHSLEALAQDLQLSHPEAHRAVHDARVGAELFLYLGDLMSKQPRRVARQILQVIDRGDYPLRSFFREVFTNKDHDKKDGSGLPSWPTHNDHALERKPEGDLLDLSDLKKALQDKAAAELPGFEVRPGQLKLIQALRETLKAPGTNLIEVGTGIGRRYAALMASLLGASAEPTPGQASPKSTEAKDSAGQKLVESRLKSPSLYAVAGEQAISTNLDAAFALAKIFGKRLAVLDQPQNYICKKPFLNFIGKKQLTEAEIGLAIKLFIWLDWTRTGHFSEVATIWDESFLLKELSGMAHACSPKNDPGECYYCLALKRAKNADTVMTTHASLLRLIGDKNTELNISSVILDDAQLLEDQATKSLGSVVHQGQIERLLGRLKQLMEPALITALENQLTLLAGLFGVFVERHTKEIDWAGRRTIVINEAVLGGEDYQKLRMAIKNFTAKLAELEGKAGKNNKASSVAMGFIRMINEIGGQLNQFIESKPSEWILELVLDDKQMIMFSRRPIAVKDFLSERLYGGGRAIILLGPRLRVSQKFSFIKERLGLPADVKEQAFESSLDLKTDTALVSLNDFPDSYADDWVSQTAVAIAKISLTVGGRVLVLFSNKRSIVAVNSVLEDLLRKNGIRIFAQGITGGRGKNLQMLAKESPAIFLASYNFVHGLKFEHGFNGVVLTKLPFAYPGEPLYAAQSQKYRAGFMQLEVPRVSLTIREQFDRLIKRPGDRGVLVVLDNKFLKDYGSAFVDSLPAVPHHVIGMGDLAETIKIFRGSPRLSSN